MKRLLFILILACGFLQARAQGPVHISALEAYPYNSNCPSPVSAQIMLYGYTYFYLPSDSIEIAIDFGDGDDTTYKVLNYISWAQAGYFNAYMPHTYNVDGNYVITSIVTGPDGAADTAVTGLTISSTCNNITGKAYVDVNGNCTYDAGDEDIRYMPLNLYHNGIKVMSTNTDGLGNYQLSAFTGASYVLRPTGGYENLYDYTCSGDSIAFTLTSSVVGDFIAENGTGISITYAGDSLGSYCNAPAVPFFTIYGLAVDYAANDVVTIYANFGDGDDTTFTTTLYSNNFIQSYSAYAYHTYQASGTYSLMFIVTGSDGKADTLIQPNAITISGTCGNLSGNVYLDQNSDCLNNSGDLPATGLPVMLWQGSTFMGTVYTDLNGNYTFQLPAGTYTVTLGNISSTGITASCPVSGSHTVTVTTSATTTADFGLVIIRPRRLDGFKRLPPRTPCLPVSGGAQFFLPPGIRHGNAYPGSTDHL
jgi:hypothetical protein